MNKIDTAASKGFRIASRLIGYIGLGLSIALFVLGYAMPQGFWIKGCKKYCLAFLGDWGRLDLAANRNKLITLGVVAGAILIVAILFRIISACCKKTVEEAVADECEKTVQAVGKELTETTEHIDKKTGKLRTYLDEKVKEVVPEDKMHYVDSANEFLKKYSSVILASAATVAVLAVLSGARNSRRRDAERRRFLRNLM